MIIIVGACMTGRLWLEVHLQFGPWGTGVFGVAVLILGGLVWDAVRGLEAVEACKKRFTAAHAEATEGLQGDQLGPAPFASPGLMQDGNHDVDYYIAEARTLFEAFKSEVLAVVAQAADPTGEVITVLSNLKGREVSGVGEGGREKGEGSSRSSSVVSWCGRGEVEGSRRALSSSCRWGWREKGADDHSSTSVA